MRLRVLINGKWQNVDGVEDYSVCKEGTDIPLIKPKIDISFLVSYKSWDMSLFSSTRTDPKQEELRMRILNTLQYVKAFESYSYPSNYVEFRTEYKHKYWDSPCQYRNLDGEDSVRGDVYRICGSRGFIANTCHYDLILGQRINNGESWYNICNCSDTERYVRIVKSMKGLYEYHIVGGGTSCFYDYPPAHVGDSKYMDRISDHMPIFCKPC